MPVDPDVRRQLREVAEAATEVFPNVDRVFAGIFDPPTVLSLLDALDEADRRFQSERTARDIDADSFRGEIAGLTEALAVAREAMRAARRHARNEDCDGCLGLIDRAIARIDTLTAPQGEPT